MKISTFIFGLLILSINACQKKAGEWTVIYGELNDNLAYNEVNGKFYYDNIEYFFINNMTKKCYRYLDSNQNNLATNLINNKLAELNKNKINKMFFKEANVSIRKEDYINIEFVDKEGRMVLYKINLSDTINDNVYVFSKYKNKYVDTYWPDRKNKTRRTKKLRVIEIN